MRVDELLKIYRRGEKFLVLNPLLPAWVVTNANGVLLIKIFAETLSTQETIREVSSRTKIPVQSVVNFLEAARREGLFEVPPPPPAREPFQLRAVYLNMTDACNLRCVYCLAAARKESSARLTLDDYKKILDAVINPTAKAGGLQLKSNRFCHVWLYDGNPAPSYVQRGIDVCIQRVPARSTDKMLLVSSAFLINMFAF